MTRINRSTLVFFDASCLMAAAGRAAGGSGFVLSLCSRRLLRLAISQTVLLEAESNRAEKFAPEALTAFRRLLEEMPIVAAAVPAEEARQACRAIVGDKDDHVLASAPAVEAPFLLTLDRRLERSVNDAHLYIRALASGEFITGVLPAHDEFASLRE